MLAKHPVSFTHLGDLKGRFNGLVHSYTSTPNSYFEFKWHREYFRALKSLKNNKSLVITRPDEDSGVVILDNWNLTIRNIYGYVKRT